MGMGKLVVVLLLAPLLLFGLGGPPADAGSCASGATCNIELTNANISQLAGVDVRVTINNTGATTVLSVQLISSPLTNTPLGVDQFDYQSSVLVTKVSEAGWTTNVANDQLDGFGKFLIGNANAAGTGGISSPISFTLASLVTSFPDNTNGAEFGVHVRFGGECSGFISDGTADSIGSNTNCTRRVAEPSVLLLVGTGLVGLGYLRRRWSWKA
jgi:hypothetical protein